MSPPEDVPTFIRSFGRRDEGHGNHMASRMVTSARLLLHASAAAARANVPTEPPARGPLRLGALPAEMPQIEESVRVFVPTTICVVPPPWPTTCTGASDCDSSLAPRFKSAAYVVQSHRRLATWQVARAYLAPPALHTETPRRAQLLASTGKGVTCRERRVLSRRLTRSEAEHIGTLEETMALLPVIAATEGLAAMLSADGSWPTSPFVEEVAARLGVRIVRFSLAGVPDSLLRGIRVVRYGERSRGTARA